jgi:hypothetical protein
MLGFWVGDRHLLTISCMKPQRYICAVAAQGATSKNKQREIPKSSKR